jgi:hypothetical protein
MEKRKGRMGKLCGKNKNMILLRQTGPQTVMKVDVMLSSTLSP